MSTDFLQESIDNTKALIRAYEATVLDLVSGRVQQYTLDTGQSRQVVTKLNISVLHKAIDELYNRLWTLEARQGKGTSTVRPAW